MDKTRSDNPGPATTNASQIGDVPIVADPQAGSAGLVATQFATVATPPHLLALEGGQALGPITVAYETYGTLNERRDNAVLVSHALSGDAHVAGRHKPDDKRLGWWDMLVGPGKALDTDRYFVICTNVLGGCNGSTGPGSINPATGEPFGTDFPIITIADMVDVQALLLDELGIPKLLATIGGSMGGMQALQLAVAYPERTHSVIAVATAAQQSPQAIAFNEVGRQAIMADPNWRGGHYYGHKLPRRGLSVARMIGHITYLSDIAMREKFGRRLQERPISRSPSRPTSRSKATCTTRAWPSPTASTPTATCTSRGRSTTSTSHVAGRAWPTPCATPRRATSSCRSRATGCTRPTSSSRS